MTRPDLQELYQHLMDEEFRFMGVGEHRLNDVYNAVKHRYPELCDDTYHESGEPGWKHIVRTSLDALELQGDITIESVAVPDSFSDLEMHLEALMRSSGSDAFLVVEIAGTQDFLQFTAADLMIQLDFPVVTEKQVLLEPKLRTIAQELELEVYESGDEHRFLDIDLYGTTAEIAQTVQHIFHRLYDAGPETPLQFNCNNCEY